MSEEAFLQLPSVDLEAVSPPAGTELRVGDPVLVRIVGAEAFGHDRSKGAVGWKLEAPQGSEPLSDSGWEVLFTPDASGLHPRAAGSGSGGASAELLFRLVPLRAGKLMLPSLALVDPRGTPVARTNPWSREVTSVFPAQASGGRPSGQGAGGEDGGFSGVGGSTASQAGSGAEGEAKDGLVPPRPPVALELPLWARALVWSFAALAFVGLALLSRRLWRTARERLFRRKQPGPGPVMPPEPEDRVALRALDLLVAQGYPMRGEFKLYYFNASAILKAYFGARYSVDANESTSAELLGLLKAKGVRGEWLPRLETLLASMDLVKFADLVPTEFDAQRVVAEIRDLVLLTRRQPRVPALTPASVSSSEGAGATAESSVSGSAGGTLKGSSLGILLLFGWGSGPVSWGEPAGFFAVSAWAESPAVQSPAPALAAQGERREAPPLEAYLENRRGLEAFQGGRVQEAQRRFGGAQALAPLSSELRFNQGTIQLHAGELDAAIEGLGAAARSAEQTGDSALAGRSYFNQGAALAKKGDLPAAIRSYLSSIDQARAAKDARLEEDARKNIERLSAQRQQQKKKEQEKKERESGQQQEKKNGEQGESQAGKGKDKKSGPGQAGQGEGNPGGGSGEGSESAREQAGQGGEKESSQAYQDTSGRGRGSFRSRALSREDAERVMSELANRERELQARHKMLRGAPEGGSKDW